ncbi:MAG: glycosyltransferase [Candidatus Bathyarchaeota archaeon]|nr:glycosyltransferase [Candidatus Bathyarchaeota archaeon]
MGYKIAYLISGLFTVFSVLILVYAANNLYLIWATRKYKDREAPELSYYPKVAVQLPVYNEKDLVSRLIDDVVNLDYPKESLEIQILDDSIDETREIINEKITGKPFIKVIRRESREGYKAGALQNGLHQTDAEYFAIFDADFLPEPDFLRRVIPIMESDPEIGLVQTRWGHINKGFNRLTRAIALALDWHHYIEQVGRNASNLFINFNGSCGVMRRTAIIDAGGWKADTLSEDLDISYRIQMKNWKAAYIRDVVVPGEIPPTIEDYRIQQRRWARGSIQCSKKLFNEVLNSDLSTKQKLQSILHLNGYSVYLWTMLLMILSVPALLLNTKTIPDALGTIGLIGAFSHVAIYFILMRKNKAHWLGFTRDFLFLFVSSLGLSLECSIAVIHGLFKQGGEFQRTPKYNIKSENRRPQMRNAGNKHLIPELLLSVYAAIGLVLALMRGNTGMLVYFTLHTIGFLTVLLLSVKPSLF